MPTTIEELQQRLVTLEGEPIDTTWQLANGTRKLVYTSTLTMPNHLHAPRGIGSKYRNVFESRVFLLSDLLLITKPYSKDRSKLVLLSDPLDLDQCNVTHVFYNDDCEFAVEENTLDKTHAAHKPTSSAAEDITVQVFGFRTKSVEDKAAWVERLHKAICTAKGMDFGKQQSHLNLLEFRRHNSTHRLRAAVKDDPFAMIPGLHERSHSVHSPESSRTTSRRNSMDRGELARSRSNSRSGSQRKLSAVAKEAFTPVLLRRGSSGVKRTASKDGIKVYTRPPAPALPPLMTRRRSLLLSDDENDDMQERIKAAGNPTHAHPSANTRTRAMAQRFSQDISLVAPPVELRTMRQTSGTNVGSGKTKVKDLAEAFTKSASMEALLQARRQSKALSSDRLLPKEGHTVKVTERLLAAQQRSRESLQKLPSSEALRVERQAIQEGTHRRLLTKFEEEQQRLHALQLAAEKQNADWQKQEVRAAYATGHEYFAKFGLGAEPEPVEAPPTRKHKRMSFDIPKTDRNVANLIAQLTTATDEELKLMSESAQHSSPRRPSAALDSILSWDYSDDMAFDAVPEMDEDEDAEVERLNSRRRSSVAEPVQDPTTPLSLQASIHEVDEEDDSAERHRGQRMVGSKSTQPLEDKAAPSREKVSLLRRVWSGRSKRSPLMRKASRIKRRGRQIQVPNPVDINDAETRPGTATLRAARRSVWSSASSATRRSSLVSLGSLADRTESNPSPGPSPMRSAPTTPIDGQPLSDEVKELLVSLQGQTMPAPVLQSFRTDSAATLTSQGSSRTLQGMSTYGSGVVDPRVLNQAHTVLTVQSNRASLHELELSRLEGSPPLTLREDTRIRALNRLERRVSSSMPIEDLLRQALEHQDSGSTLILSDDEQAARKLSTFSAYSQDSRPRPSLPTVDLSFLNLSPHQRGLSPLTLPPRQQPGRVETRRTRRSTVAANSMPLGQYLKHNWESLMVPCEEQGGRLRRRPSIEDLLVQEETGNDEDGVTLLGKLRRQAEKDGEGPLGMLAKRGQEWTGDLCKDVYGLPKDRVKHLAHTRKPCPVTKLETKLTAAGISRRSSFATIVDGDGSATTVSAFGPGPQSSLVKPAQSPRETRRAPRVIAQEVWDMYQDENKVAHPSDPLPSALRWMLPEVSQLETVTAFQARALAVLHASNLLSGITCDL